MSSTRYLGIAALLVLFAGMPQVARANRDCPPECEKCLSEGGAWVNNFCIKPLRPDMTYLEDIVAEDPVLIG